MPELTQLTEAQRSIYEGLASGATVERIAQKLGTTPALVNANITRIKNKGFELPKPGSPKLSVPVTHVETKDLLGSPPEKPVASGGSENDRIAAQLNVSGKAISADELRALADKVAGPSAREVQPFVLMGLTIQYVKLCGGRMTAHQVIEDVYGALRAFAGETGGSVPEDVGGETKPLPSNEKERVTFLEEQVKAQDTKISDLQAQLRKFTGASSPYDSSYGGGYGNN